MLRLQSVFSISDSILNCHLYQFICFIVLLAEMHLYVCIKLPVFTTVQLYAAFSGKESGFSMMN